MANKIKDTDYLAISARVRAMETTLLTAERVERLLDINYNTSKEPSGNLGIANVNQRLRILFGPPCGLSIREEGGRVTARLTIPFRRESPS